MTRYLWLSVSVCCAAALWSACGPPPNSCQVSADCFPDEVCVSNLCVPKPSEDGGTEVSDAGTGGGDGTTGGGDGTQSGGGSATGGGSAVGGGDPTGGGQGVDAGMPDCEAGDTLPCCSGRGVQTCDSDGTWSACDATVSSESCNGIDDDCNGTVDNDVLFSMPDGGVAMNVTCTIGVGACESSGSLACATDGGVVCGAAVIEPTTEICDDIDNDCDGQTDEGTKVLCMIDADNDHYAGSSVQQEFCPDTTRSDFGNCPVGYVATSLGTDCNDSDANTYRTATLRTDSDGDGHCVAGGASDMCIGATPPAPYIYATSCGTDDCDDTSNAKYQLLSVRPDSDGDGYCPAVNTTSQCTGATPQPGFRLASSCNPANADCDDTTAAKYQTLVVRIDNDGDSYCTSAGSVPVCSGATPTNGYRLATSCAATDDCNDGDAARKVVGKFRLDFDGDTFCNDTALHDVCYSGSGPPPTHYATTCPTNLDCNDFDPAIYQNVNLKLDQDNDSYCTSAPEVLTCIGNTVPAGKRVATQCNATADCKDDNYYATSSCTKSITSNTYAKQCDVGIGAEVTWNFFWNCGNGFHTTAGQFVDSNRSDGDDAYYHAESYNLGQSTAVATITCRAAQVGFDDYWVAVTCSAD